MAFASSGGSETLFVSVHQGLDGDRLGQMDTTDFELGGTESYIGRSVNYVQLTGDSAGRLFAFQGSVTGDSFLFGILPRNGRVTATYPLPGRPVGIDWAVAFWGGSLYLFTSSGGVATSIVSRFEPSSSAIAGAPAPPQGALIVTAGVSTCAPLH